ncbi:MAG: helix-turn-helix domain-containing protein [Acidimicrobiales bacterium]
MTSGSRRESGPAGTDLLRGAPRGLVSVVEGDPAAEEVSTGCSDEPRRRGRDPGGRARQRPLTLSEAASHLNVTDRYVRRLVAERRVPYLKVGRLLRFREADLDAYLESCRVEPVSSGQRSHGGR